MRKNKTAHTFGTTKKIFVRNLIFRVNLNLEIPILTVRF